MHETLDLTLKAVGLLVGAVFSLYQARHFISPSRTRLKTDLEILKLLEESHPSRPLLQAIVDTSLREIYGTPTPAVQQTVQRRQIHRWGDFIGGILMMIVFGAATFYILLRDPSWWALLTAFFTFAGFGGIVTSYEPKEKK
jgi:hypothetical protein